MEQGEDLSEETYGEILQSLYKACMQRCGILLGSRDYSEQRMREKLRDAGYPGSVVDNAVEKLRKAGYLDDRRFAQSYVRSHMRDRSRLRIRLSTIRKRSAGDRCALESSIGRCEGPIICRAYELTGQLQE